MGEETIEFASRFSSAVRELSELASDEGHRALLARHGPDLAARVKADLDAIEAVFEKGTEAVRDWANRRRLVLGQLARMREALGRSRIDDQLRRMAAALVEAIDPGEVGHEPRP